MKCNCCWMLAALVVAGMAGSQAAAQNQLVDGGFEDPLKYTSDGPPFVGFWEGFSAGAGSFSAHDTSMPLSGSGNAHLGIANVDNSFAGLFQDVPVVAGQIVTFSGFNKAATLLNGPAAEFRIEWRNAVSDTEVSRTDNGMLVLTTAYTPFSRTHAAPAGADIARVAYAIQTFTPGDNTADVFLDDLSVVIVPEPATLALAGMAGLALLAVRRRK